MHWVLSKPRDINFSILCCCLLLTRQMWNHILIVEGCGKCTNNCINRVKTHDFAFTSSRDFSIEVGGATQNKMLLRKYIQRIVLTQWKHNQRANKFYLSKKVFHIFLQNTLIQIFSTTYCDWRCPAFLKYFSIKIECFI